MRTRFGPVVVVVTFAVMGLCVSAVVARAQTPITGSVSGYVTDDKQQAIPGVTIAIREVDKTVATTVITDAQGDSSASDHGNFRYGEASCFHNVQYSKGDMLKSEG